jgi:hypothetical protein
MVIRIYIYIYIYIFIYYILYKWNCGLKVESSDMQSKFLDGEEVKIVGGKYVGEKGVVEKCMWKMIAVRLVKQNVMVRVMQENVVHQVVGGVMEYHVASGSDTSVVLTMVALEIQVMRKKIEDFRKVNGKATD